MAIKLAENIKSLRELKKLTQSDLADLLSVTPQSVSRWENGQAYPDIEKLPAIAKLFGVTLDELMGSARPVIFDYIDQLKAINKLVLKSDTTENRLKQIEIHELIIKEGELMYLSEYFLCVTHLYKNGDISSERLASARQLCREAVSSFHGDKLNHKLIPFVTHDNLEDVNVWADLISTDNMLSTFDDVLLTRYLLNGESELWETQRQTVVFKDIKKILLNLTNKCGMFSLSFVFSSCATGADFYNNCRRAYELLNIFSSRPDDVFLSIRVHVEYHLAESCFAENREEEGFAMLSLVREHLLLEKSLLNKTLYGSTDTFFSFSLLLEDNVFYNTLFCMDLSSKSFDNIREDQRFINFVDLKSHLTDPKITDPFGNMDLNDASAFRSLLSAAKNERSEHVFEEGLWSVIALKTKNNNQYNLVVRADPMDENAADENELIKLLRKNSDTQIEYIACILASKHPERDCIEIISQRLRIMLCDLDPHNLNAKLLLKGIKGDYVARPVAMTLHKYDRLKYEDKEKGLRN